MFVIALKNIFWRGVVLKFPTFFPKDFTFANGTVRARPAGKIAFFYIISGIYRQKPPPLAHLARPLL
jgi:hypothetical protein